MKDFWCYQTETVGKIPSLQISTLDNFFLLNKHHEKKVFLLIMNTPPASLKDCGTRASSIYRHNYCSGNHNCVLSELEIKYHKIMFVQSKTQVEIAILN